MLYQLSYQAAYKRHPMCNRARWHQRVGGKLTVHKQLNIQKMVRGTKMTLGLSIRCAFLQSDGDKCYGGARCLGGNGNIIIGGDRNNDRIRSSSRSIRRSSGGGSVFGRQCLYRSRRASNWHRFGPARAGLHQTSGVHGQSDVVFTAWQRGQWRRPMRSTAVATMQKRSLGWWMRSLCMLWLRPRIIRCRRLGCTATFCAITATGPWRGSSEHGRYDQHAADGVDS